MKKIKMWQTALIVISVISFGIEYREALARWIHLKPQLPKTAPYAVSVLDAYSIRGFKQGDTDRVPTFVVMVHNISGDTQQVWSQDWAGISAAVTLEVLAVDGKQLKEPITVERDPEFKFLHINTIAFTPTDEMRVELPMHEYIKGERANPRLASEISDYKNFPSLSAGKHVLKVRAAFESRRRDLPGSDEVWTGRVVSDPLDYTVMGPYL